MSLNLTRKIISWNFISKVFEVSKLLSSTAEYRPWRELLKTFSIVLLFPYSLQCISLMLEWLHLMLMGPIDWTGLFAHMVLWCSSGGCSIMFSITPSQITDIIPNKQQPEAANPSVAVLVCINGFSSQVCHYPAVLAFKTTTAAKISALDLC